MDYGHKMADDILSDLEAEINEIYSEASKTAKKKADKYFEEFKKQDAEMAKKVEQKQLTEQEYKQWRLKKLMQGSKYTSMAEGLAEDMTNANKLAASAINGHLPDVYASNYNWATYEIEQNARIDTNFMIYDRQTVERLIRDNPELLPMKAGVSIPDDIKWNKKKINGAITQGILLGESIPNIADRLVGVTDMNRSAAVRNARTMTTSAENGGRIDSYKRATDMGIKLTQEWLATNDKRTRHEHAMLDGQEVAVGKPFKVEGYEIRFPADPTAEPFLVYNCRCTLISNFKGFDYKKMDDYVKETPMTYKEWEKSRQKPQVDNKVVNGKDITSIFKRDKSKYEYEIDDVIHAQGFDGLPKVVTPDEFDKYVKEANGGNGFIAQRTYSAPTQEVLDVYREQLYNGKWYVDCSIGHSSFGQGMYCTPEFATKMSKRGLQEQELYGRISRDRIEENAKNQYLFDKYSIALDKVIKENGITDSEIIDVLKAYDPVQGRYHDNEWNVTKNVDWVKEFASSNPEKYRTAKAIIENNEDELEKAYKSATKESKSYETIKAKSYTETFTLTSDAKIANYSELVKEIKGTGYTDIGVFAAAKGYDAVNIDVLDGTIEAKQALILNRTKCIFKGGD